MLGRLQQEIEAIYRLDIPYRVEDFVIDADTRARLHPDATAPEEVLVVEDEGEMSLAVYIDAGILARLGHHDPDDPEPTVLEAGLPAFATALEGVSHFVYLAHCAARDREVSLLELEAQAEVDKFVTGVLHLWRRGRKGDATSLRHRLFDTVGYRDDLDPDALDRYQAANGLAGRYCACLEDRFLDDGTPEGLLREVRRVYRLGGPDKMACLH